MEHPRIRLIASNLGALVLKLPAWHRRMESPSPNFRVNFSRQQAISIWMIRAKSEPDLVRNSSLPFSVTGILTKYLQIIEYFSVNRPYG
jgi:hypothetical protein